MVAKGSAMIIDPETYQTHTLDSWSDVSKAKEKFAGAMIRSTKLSLVPPEVVVLTGYEGMAERSVVFSRRNIFKRDKYSCMYCGAQPGPDSLTIDHIVPKSRGGKSIWENCVLACMACNKKKADHSLEKSGLKLRKAPKKPSWKVLTMVSPKDRLQSWEQFLGTAYWSVEIES